MTSEGPSRTDSELRVVLCNCPVDGAAALARALVEARVAACVNILAGVTSVYRWEGRVCEDAEKTLLIKTTAGRMAALTAAIRDRHPYDVPEIIALPVQSDEGEPAYHAWVRDEVHGD